MKWGTRRGGRVWGWEGRAGVGMGEEGQVWGWGREGRCGDGLGEVGEVSGLV